MEAEFLSVPRLARMLGVSAPAIRYWVRQGWVEPPRPAESGVTPVYTARAASDIESWYLRRSAAGLCRGIGAEAKRCRALSRLPNGSS